MCRKISGSRSKKYSQVSSSKKNSRSVEPRSVSGYFSSVFLHVSNRRPDTLMSIFSSSGFRLSFNTGGGGRGLAAMGTQPTAAARANGNQAVNRDFHFSAKVCGKSRQLTRCHRSHVWRNISFCGGKSSRNSIRDGFPPCLPSVNARGTLSADFE